MNLQDEMVVDEIYRYPKHISRPESVVAESMLVVLDIILVGSVLVVGPVLGVVGLVQSRWERG